MLKTVRDACHLHEMALDYQMSEAVENLGDLIDEQGGGAAFFARNYITHGMDELFREGLLRLAGKSDQAVFELAQAMGGGKTHMMIALGLLAKHPERRKAVVPDLAERAPFEQARIAVFNGRNTPEHFVWGEIAEQLGQGAQVRDTWANGPKPIDEKRWLEIIGNEPTLILLDELPPYLDQANAYTIGQSTLANLTTYSLGALFSAAAQLPRCAVVLSNLSGSYQDQTRSIHQVVSNLQQEARRQARTITPVELGGGEIYEILKKRLFTELPSAAEIDEVAEAIAGETKRAEDGGYLTARNLERVADQVRETYPFHPAFKHIVAMFKENPGFRQTRGLMQFAARLIKSVWTRRQNDVFLIGTQHLNLNDADVRDEIQRINKALIPAMTTDVADGGNAHAEEIDAQLNSDAGSQVASLVLTGSLSRAVNARAGLTRPEIIEFLVAPNRKPDEFDGALEELRKAAWYLHREEERYYFKDTENLTKQIERDAEALPASKVEQKLVEQVTELLQPKRRNAYQKIQVLPQLDTVESELRDLRVLLVVRPDGSVPPETIKRFFDHIEQKNNLLVLSGQDSHQADSVEKRLREYYAISRIADRLKAGDTLKEEAEEKRREAWDLFLKSVASVYNRLLFPGPGGLQYVTIDQGLRFSDNETTAEAQLEALLASARCDNKLALDSLEEPLPYWAMAEAELWPQNGERKVPWTDILKRARTRPEWPWMPGAQGMAALKAKALTEGRWRESEAGVVEKGPFPKQKTAVNVSPQGVDEAAGESILSLMPRNAGATPTIHYNAKPQVSASDPPVQDLDNFRTKAATLYFIAVDSDGQHETGEPTKWTAELKIRHQVHSAGESRRVELQVIPEAALHYTTDGSNPREGTRYDGPFEVDDTGCLVQVRASAGDAAASEKFTIPAKGESRPQVDETRPAQLNSGTRVSLDSTEKAFQVLTAFRDDGESELRGVHVVIGERERAVSARVLEQAIQGVRAAIGDPQAEVAVTVRDGGQFRSGYDLKRFAEIAGLELTPEMVAQ